MASDVVGECRKCKGDIVVDRYGTYSHSDRAQHIKCDTQQSPFRREDILFN
jgi:hypothetical protein